MVLALDNFKTTFREEACALLDHLEDDLLELESHSQNGDLINAVFRAIYTVKESAAIFGFDPVSQFAQGMEKVFELCRNGTLSITKEFVSLMLKGREQLRQLMEFEKDVPPDIAMESERLLLRFDDFSRKGQADAFPSHVHSPHRE